MPGEGPLPEAFDAPYTDGDNRPVDVDGGRSRMRELFMRLLAAGTEDEVQAILDAAGLASDDSKWTPYGDNEAFYGVVENQQAHPVPALVEKITNGIDAILERKVLEAGLDIRSAGAPRSVREALDRYFPDHRNWDLGDARRQQARSLQIVASGPRRDTSLLVYDDGDGQAPADFPGTFLSVQARVRCAWRKIATRRDDDGRLLVLTSPS